MMISKEQKKEYSHDKLVPTSTVIQSRLQMFQPTRRPVAIDKTFQTAHGAIRVKGKLGQIHADVLEAIMYSAEKKGEADGRIKLLVDPAKVRKIAKVGGKQLQLIVEDLGQVLIEIKNPVSLHLTEGLGHLIDQVDTAIHSDGVVVTRYNPLNKSQRKLWRVELGKALCRLIQADIWLSYNPAQIAGLKSGISQALARHILSHKSQPQGGWRLDTLIVAVAGDLSDTAIRDKRREIRADAAQLNELGIVIDNDRVYK